MGKKKRAQLRAVKPAPAVFIASATASHSFPEPAPATDYDLSTAVLIALKRVLYGEQSKHPLSRTLRQAYRDQD